MAVNLNMKRVHAHLAPLMDYPSDGYLERLKEIAGNIKAEYPDAASEIVAFLYEDHGDQFPKLQELYTRTFDMAPVCYPYLSSYLYGDENFARGDLMFRLQEQYSRHGLDTKGELPDHIGIVLRFTEFLDQEELEDLVQYCLRQPLAEMVILLDGANSPFARLARAIKYVFDRDFPERESND
jgi:nitrate reductase molybdenum cofactor assembly chaperone NarJ/NarW